MTELHPSEEIGPLIAETARLWRTRLDARLQPLGLSQARWRVLVALAKAGEEGLLQRELAEMIWVEQPTVAAVVDRMEKDGWIERRTREEDRRCKTILLTPQAHEAVSQVFAEASRLREEICHELGKAQLEQCVDTLSHIKQRLLQL